MAWRGLQGARRVYERARRGPVGRYRVGKNETAVKRRGLALRPGSGGGQGRAGAVDAWVQGRSDAAYPIPWPRAAATVQAGHGVGCTAGYRVGTG